MRQGEVVPKETVQNLANIFEFNFQQSDITELLFLYGETFGNILELFGIQTKKFTWCNPTPLVHWKNTMNALPEPHVPHPDAGIEPNIFIYNPVQETTYAYVFNPTTVDATDSGVGDEFTVSRDGRQMVKNEIPALFQFCRQNLQGPWQLQTVTHYESVDKNYFISATTKQIWVNIEGHPDGGRPQVQDVKIALVNEITIGEVVYIPIGIGVRRGDGVGQIGHYYAYIRTADHTRAHRWFKCDDDDVQQVGWNIIKNDEKNAYVICWAKRDRVELSHRRPTGIQNAANTCYFNTLLQILFNVIEIENVRGGRGSAVWWDMLFLGGGGSGAGVYTYIKEKFKNNNMNENIKVIEDKNKSQTEKENEQY